MKKLFLSLITILILNFMALPASAEIVVFNHETKKYHKISCVHAKRCTVNCAKIEKSEAIKRGGKPCKTCGG